MSRLGGKSANGFGYMGIDELSEHRNRIKSNEAWRIKRRKREEEVNGPYIYTGM